MVVELLEEERGVEDLARRFCCSCDAREEELYCGVPTAVEGINRSMMDRSSSTLNKGILALIFAAAASLCAFHKLPPTLFSPVPVDIVDVIKLIRGPGVRSPGLASKSVSI